MLEASPAAPRDAGDTYMQARRMHRWTRALAVAALGTTVLLGDCDPTIRATVESGIINSTTSFLTAFYQALLQVFQEAREANDPNQTAAALELVARFFA
jgi:hypothetical protein